MALAYKWKDSRWKQNGVFPYSCHYSDILVLGACLR